MKKISLLGSTGSIGTQSLDVCEMHGYDVKCLTANSKVDIMAVSYTHLTLPTT